MTVKQSRRYHLCQERKKARKELRARRAYNSQFVKIYVGGSQLICHKKDFQKLVEAMPAEVIDAQVDEFRRSMQFRKVTP